jgi:hypothetical protein
MPRRYWQRPRKRRSVGRSEGFAKDRTARATPALTQNRPILVAARNDARFSSTPSLEIVPPGLARSDVAQVRQAKIAAGRREDQMTSNLRVEDFVSPRLDAKSKTPSAEYARTCPTNSENWRICAQSAGSPAECLVQAETINCRRPNREQRTPHCFSIQSRHRFASGLLGHRNRTMFLANDFSESSRCFFASECFSTRRRHL